MATRPLILAIEPDRRQAACLSLVARRISAELLLVESVAEALPALRDRLPHLILTPTLLPCRDDTMLTAWLRELGEAATHIQRLTTPLLEAEAPRRGRGLSARRREKKPRTASSVACNADTFAEQLAIYLESAVAAHGARRRTQVSRPEEAVASEAPPEPPLHTDDVSPIASSEDPPQSVLDPPPSAVDPPPSEVDPPPSALDLPQPFALDLPQQFTLPAPDLSTPDAAESTLTPLPSMSLRIESGVSAMDALPVVPEAMCRMDALVTALAGGTPEDMLVHAPPIAQSGIVELPSIRASSEAGTPDDDADADLYVLPPPALLPESPDVPAIGVLTETVGDDLARVPALIEPSTLQAPPPVRSAPRSTADASSRRRPVKPLPPVRPNGRMMRKAMRRMHATDWTP